VLLKLTASGGRLFPSLLSVSTEGKKERAVTMRPEPFAALFFPPLRLMSCSRQLWTLKIMRSDWGKWFWTTRKRWHLSKAPTFRPEVHWRHDLTSFSPSSQLSWTHHNNQMQVQYHQSSKIKLTANCYKLFKCMLSSALQVLHQLIYFVIKAWVLKYNKVWEEQYCQAIHLVNMLW
jgi:hypothetical protein